MPTFPAEFSVEDLDGTTGFRLNGVALGDSVGVDVAGIGDINGDGLADVIVSARSADSGSILGGGTAYVVFGGTAGSGADFELSELDGSNGFRIEGDIPYGNVGLDVSAAGDVNGDGVDDFMLSSTGGDGTPRYPGDTYVIYGSTAGFDAGIGTADLDGSNGFTITGTGDFNRAGRSISSAGDINGDGFDDILIGVQTTWKAASPYPAFLVYGGGNTDISLDQLDGSNGFAITGAGNSGWVISGIGDFNKDGFDDFALSTPAYGPNQSGAITVVYGQAGTYGAVFDVASIDGDNGFRFIGANTDDNLGSALADAGDVNGDGYADFIVSATYADPHGHPRAGESYVVFGTANGPASLRADQLDGSNGFVIRGDGYGDHSGSTVASAGDLNGDGFDDLIVSIDWNVDQPGTSYVVFGKGLWYTPGIDVLDLDGTNGFRIDGAPYDMFEAVDSIGDFNGDGLDDLIIGAPGALAEGVENKGAAYILYGRLPTESVVRLDGDADQTIHGGSGNDRLVSWLGDDHLIGYGGNDQLLSFKGADILEGGDGDDTYFVMNDRDDTIIDTGGNDTIQADIHWDLRDFPEIENLRLFGEGNWHMTGNARDNVLTGSYYDNRMLGLDGNDTLDGWFGNDTLIGGLGRDVMTGGPGDDRFDFLASEDSAVGATARDVITDFTPGEDRLHLGLIDADGDRSGNQAFAFIGTGSFTGDAGQLRYVQSTLAGIGPVTVVSGDIDGDGIADFEIELRGTPTLTASDFIL